MPFIQTRTNTIISKEKEVVIKNKLGELISILGKSENWLMVEFVDDANMYFKGNDIDLMAYVEIKLYGKSTREAYDNMTSEVTNLLSQELGISPSNIYVSYIEIENWGWNGNNF